MKKTNRKLGQNEFFFQIVEEFPVHIYWKDVEYRYQYCNLLQAQDFGLDTPADIVGKTEYDLCPKDVADKVRKNDITVLSSRMPGIFEEMALDFQKNLACYLTQKIPLFDAQGTLIGLAGISVNITARKNAETRARAEKENAEFKLAHIIDSLPGHIYWKDKNFVFQGCNLLQAQSAGFTNQKAMIGKTDFDMPWHDKAAELQEMDQLVMQTRQSITREEKSQLAGSDHTSTFLSKKTPLFNKKGEVTGILGISFDITDRKKLEDDIKIAKELAEKANLAKTRFLENMRHDIRTPLTGIVGFADIMKTETTEPKFKEYAENLVASSHALLDLLDEVLEAIRVSSGEIPMLRRKYDLRQTLQSIVELNRAKAKQKKIDLTFEFDTTIPQYVVGDKIRLHRIALELVANALNFTDVGHVKLSIILAKRENNTLIIKLVVEDTGIGIPQDKQQDLYLQFNRLTPSYAGIYSGAGLGLSVIKQFIDELKGEIYVDSALGKGSTFTCVLPIQEALLNNDSGIDTDSLMPIERRYAKTLAQNAQSETQSATKPGNGAILVVEDNIIAQAVVKAILSAVDCQVDIANNCDEAIDKWTQRGYDLIFMDIGLPITDGYEVTRKIRLLEKSQEGANIPIIALTAHVGEESKELCIAAGMNAVLSKPLSQECAKDILTSFIPKRHSALNKNIPEHSENAIALQPHPLFDIDAGIYASSTEELLAQIIQILINEDLQSDLTAIHNAHAAKDWELVQKIAHRMQSSALYAGATRLKFACQNLAQSPRTEVVEGLYQQLLQVLDETTPVLQKWLSNKQNS